MRILGGKPRAGRVDSASLPQERLGIVGRSGAGKSTLLSLVAGLDEPDAGSISVGGETTAAEPGSRTAR